MYLSRLKLNVNNLIIWVGLKYNSRNFQGWNSILLAWFCLKGLSSNSCTPPHPPIMWLISLILNTGCLFQSLHPLTGCLYDRLTKTIQPSSLPRTSQEPRDRQARTRSVLNNHMINCGGGTEQLLFLQLLKTDRNYLEKLEKKNREIFKKLQYREIRHL